MNLLEGQWGILSINLQKAGFVGKLITHDQSGFKFYLLIDTTSNSYENQNEICKKPPYNQMKISPLFNTPKKMFQHSTNVNVRQ